MKARTSTKREPTTLTERSHIAPGKKLVACEHHPKGSSLLFERSLEKLKTAGFKLTSSRRTLLEIMCEVQAPFTTEEVFSHASAAAKKNSKICDLVTVYRTLSTLESLQVLTRVELNDGVIRYEFSGPQGHHHHHFVCTSCRRIEPFDLCSNQSGQIVDYENALAGAGYTRLTHRLEFYGLCPTCSR